MNLARRIQEETDREAAKSAAAGLLPGAVDRAANDSAPGRQFAVSLTWLKDEAKAFRRVHGDWSVIGRELLSETLEADAKDRVPLFSPGRLHDPLPAGVRASEAAAVESMQMVVLDLDKESQDVIDGALAAIDDSGVLYAMHPSYSWTPQQPKWRIVVPLASDAAPANYARLRAGLSALAGVTGDPAAAKVAQRFYLPSKPRGAGADWPEIRRGGHRFATAEELMRHVPADFQDRAAPAKRPSGEPNINDDVLGSTQDRRDRDANLIADAGCVVVDDLRSGKHQDYQTWRGAVAGLLPWCAEGEAWSHAWSEAQRPDEYDASETQRKFDDAFVAPMRCGTLSSCQGCEHNGKLATALLLSDRAQRTAGVVGPITNNAADDADGAGPGEGESVPAVIAELNKRHAVVGRGSDFAILDRQTPRETPTGVIYGIGWKSVAWFRQFYGSKFVRNGRAGDKPVSLANYWLSHPQCAKFPDGEVFLPEGEAPPGTFNSWSGMAVDATDGDVSPWLDLLRKAIPDKATRLYVAQWFALKTQHPACVPDTLLICTGPKGSGKGSMVEPFLRMFGSHAALFDSEEQVVGRFNAHLRPLSLAVLDEAVFVGDPRQANVIKSRVTGRTMTYEAKGVDPVSGVNRCAYVMLTNHPHAWQSTVDERRAVIVEATNALCGDRAFWRRYHAWLDGDGPAHLLHWLRKVDLSNFEPRDIPRGEALRRQTELTALRDPVVAWWRNALDEGVIRLRDSTLKSIPEDEPFVVSKTDLRESFAASCRRPGNTLHLVARIEKWVGAEHMVERRGSSKGAGTRLRYLHLPALPELRTRFSAVEHVKFDEPPAEDGDD